MSSLVFGCSNVITIPLEHLISGHCLSSCGHCPGQLSLALWPPLQRLIHNQTQPNKRALPGAIVHDSSPGFLGSPPLCLFSCLQELIWNWIIPLMSIFHMTVWARRFVSVFLQTYVKAPPGTVCPLLLHSVRLHLVLSSTTCLTPVSSHCVPHLHIFLFCCPPTSAVHVHVCFSPQCHWLNRF